MSPRRPIRRAAAIVLALAGLPACASRTGADADLADDRVQAPAPAPAAPSAQAPAPPAAPAADPAMPEDSITAERLLAYVRELPTARAAWGEAAAQGGLRKTEELLAAKLRALGYEPALDPVDYLGSRVHDKEDGESKPYHNLIVEVRGTDRPREVLIVSAHMDAVPGAPGADDDGSGVATILEAARVLKDHPAQRTVRLILFTLEEAGLVGSRAYAQRLKPDLDAGKETVVGMVSIDMLGFYCAEPGCQKSPLPPSRFYTPPTTGDFVGMGGVLRYRTFSRALDAAMHDAEPAVKTVVVDFLPIAPPDLMRSDHAPFWAIGVPAVILSDTANFRSPHYHKPTDTVETLDPERFAAAARAVVGAAYRLAGPPGTTPPDLSPPAAPADAPAAEPAPAAPK